MDIKAASGLNRDHLVSLLLMHDVDGIQQLRHTALILSILARCTLFGPATDWLGAPAYREADIAGSVCQFHRQQLPSFQFTRAAKHNQMPAQTASSICLASIAEPSDHQWVLTSSDIFKVGPCCSLVSQHIACRYAYLEAGKWHLHVNARNIGHLPSEHLALPRRCEGFN